MIETYTEIDGKRYKLKSQEALVKYLNHNAKFVTKASPTDPVTKSQLSSFAPLIPIGVGILGGAIATWAINREQKEYILKNFIN